MKRGVGKREVDVGTESALSQRSVSVRSAVSNSAKKSSPGEGGRHVVRCGPGRHLESGPRGDVKAKGF